MTVKDQRITKNKLRICMNLPEWLVTCGGQGKISVTYLSPLGVSHLSWRLFCVFCIHYTLWGRGSRFAHRTQGGVWQWTCPVALWSLSACFWWFPLSVPLLWLPESNHCHLSHHTTLHTFATVFTFFMHIHDYSDTTFGLSVYKVCFQEKATNQICTIWQTLPNWICIFHKKHHSCDSLQHVFVLGIGLYYVWMKAGLFQCTTSIFHGLTLTERQNGNNTHQFSQRLFCKLRDWFLSSWKLNAVFIKNLL